MIIASYKNVKGERDDISTPSREATKNIIPLPAHPAVDVTKVQVAPPLALLHTSFLTAVLYPPITNMDPSDRTTLV